MPKRVPKYLMQMCIGQVIKTNPFWKASKVRVIDLKMDEYLKMYFNEKYHFWASDPEEKTTVGDIVCISKLKPPQSEKVQHRVSDIVFKVGAIVDPLTGRQCRGKEFVDTEHRKFDPVIINTPPAS